MTKEKTGTVRPEVLDELLQGCSTLPTQEELFGPDGVIKQLSKALIERCLQAELTTHLGYSKHERSAEEKPNHRNGSSPETLKSEHRPIEIAVPRDREGSFDPLLVKKYQQSGVFGAGGEHGGTQGTAGHVDRRERGSQVLAGRLH